MTKYSHAFEFAFEVISTEQDASDVTPKMMRDALKERANRLSNDDLEAACEHYDTSDLIN